MIFDTHTHLNDDSFSGDRDSIIRDMFNEGITSFTEIGYDMESSINAVKLAERYSSYATIGFHPDHIVDMSERSINELRELSHSDRVVAIGEIGLDYYYIDKRSPEEKEESERAKLELDMLNGKLGDSNPTGDILNSLGYTKKTYKDLKKLAEKATINYDPEPEVQKSAFIRQIELSRELRLPIVVHSRDSAKDTYDIIKSYRAYENGGIMHCFSYTIDMARKFIELGMYIGVGGVVTFPNGRKLKEVVENIPLSSIVLETDCPYMSPTPHRGERNSPLNLKYVISEIASIKGISEEDVIEMTLENARRVYRIEK